MQKKNTLKQVLEGKTNTTINIALIKSFLHLHKTHF